MSIEIPLCSAVFAKRLPEPPRFDRILFKMLPAQSFLIFSVDLSGKKICWINATDFHKLPVVSIHFFVSSTVDHHLKSSPGVDTPYFLRVKFIYFICSNVRNVL